MTLRRLLPWAIPAALLLAHPILPELVLQVPVALAALALAAAGTAGLVLAEHRRTLFAATMALALAIALEPLSCAVTVLIPLVRQDQGRLRFGLSGALASVLALALLASPTLEEGLRTLDHEGATKATEGILVAVRVLESTVLPWRTKILGVHRHESAVAGTLMLALVAMVFGALLASGKRSRSRVLGLHLCIGLFACVGPGVFGRPRLAYGALFVAAAIFL